LCWLIPCLQLLTVPGGRFLCSGGCWFCSCWQFALFFSASIWTSLQIQLPYCSSELLSGRSVSV
jgi:hypothetical protein